MANITLKNNPISTCGDLPNIGEQAKDFSLIGKDLKERHPACIWLKKK